MPRNFLRPAPKPARPKAKRHPFDAPAATWTAGMWWAAPPPGSPPPGSPRVPDAARSWLAGPSPRR